MKKLSLDKLKPFILMDEDPPIKSHKVLSEIHTADNFSIASNGAMAAVIYETNDHYLNYTFGDCVDMILSTFKYCHNKDYDEHQVTVNRKQLIDVVNAQFKALKEVVKTESKKTIRNIETFTMLCIDPDNYKLYIQTNCNHEDKYGRKYTVTEQPEICIDFAKARWSKPVTDIKITFNTKYLIEFLTFMVGYEFTTIRIPIDRATSIRCEEDDREVMLMGVNTSK